jgi:plastocyanin
MQGRGRRIAAMALAALGLLVCGALSGAAQDATPATSAGEAHPAHIHRGSCDKLDPQPAYPLTDVTLPAMATPAATGGATAIPVERSRTVVDVTLDELQTGGYAINVHKSAQDIDTYIACGNLNGAIVPGGTGDQSPKLAVGLHELNNSGYSGIAVLTAKGNQTDVAVYLAQGLSGTAGATGQATPASASGATANAVTVDIKDFAFHPATVEIPVGGTITWTNSDAVEHTATGLERSVLQSGTIEPGASFSQTFNQAGTYNYFCEFHANMKGTIIVR